MKPDYKLVAKARYIHLVSDLAAELWGGTYARRLPKNQLDAWVARAQSPEAIEEDIDRDVNYFLVVLGGKNVGYFAWEMQNTALHLMHLYLKPEVRGRSLGGDILLYCERLARADGKGRVWCSVDAKNQETMGFFKHRRYRVLNETEADLGGGAVMLQAELEKTL